MNATLRLPAPAKLNLFLHILGQRPDGYHLLETLFQLLDWGDELEFRPHDSVILKQSPATDFSTEENLVYRAARLLQTHTGCNRGVAITLKKQIPIGAGLGGGSSDAATTLLGLNHFWELGLGMDELAELGLSLGADVPVFIRGQTALAYGVGEQLQPVKLKENWFLVVTPRVHISTAGVFGHPELTRNGKSIVDSRESQLTCEGWNSKIRALSDLAGRNDCQAVVEILHPEVAIMLKALKEFGLVRMSGTGSSLFIPFPNRMTAERVKKQLPEIASIEAIEHSAFIARGVNQSAVHAMLTGCQTS